MEKKYRIHLSKADPKLCIWDEARFPPFEKGVCPETVSKIGFTTKLSKPEVLDALYFGSHEVVERLIEEERLKINGKKYKVTSWADEYVDGVQIIDLRVTEGVNLDDVESVTMTRKEIGVLMDEFKRSNDKLRARINSQKRRLEEDKEKFENGRRYSRLQDKQEMDEQFRLWHKALTRQKIISGIIFALLPVAIFIGTKL